MTADSHHMQKAQKLKRQLAITKELKIQFYTIICPDFWYSSPKARVQIRRWTPCVMRCGEQSLNVNTLQGPTLPWFSYPFHFSGPCHLCLH